MHEPKKYVYFHTGCIKVLFSLNHKSSFIPKLDILYIKAYKGMRYVTPAFYFYTFRYIMEWSPLIPGYIISFSGVHSNTFKFLQLINFSSWIWRLRVSRSKRGFTSYTHFSSFFEVKYTHIPLHVGYFYTSSQQKVIMNRQQQPLRAKKIYQVLTHTLTK